MNFLDFLNIFAHVVAVASAVNAVVPNPSKNAGAIIQGANQVLQVLSLGIGNAANATPEHIAALKAQSNG